MIFQYTAYILRAKLKYKQTQINQEVIYLRAKLTFPLKSGTGGGVGEVKLVVLSHTCNPVLGRSETGGSKFEVILNYKEFKASLGNVRPDLKKPDL